MTRSTSLLHELIAHSATRAPASPALSHRDHTLSYEALHGQVQALASALMNLRLSRGDRVGIYLEKRFETVVASFGAPAAGGVFVPMNPLLKPEQVGFIARDCAVRFLVTSADRYAQLLPVLAECPSIEAVVLTEGAAEQTPQRWAVLDWPPSSPHRRPTPPRHRH